jgi:putative tryptophan/tyrosine transport system substrate-binding protein
MVQLIEDHAMERRTFMAVISGGLLAAPLAAEAQPAAKAPRIGVLLPGTPATATRSPRMQAFYQSLRELGWVEGQNVVFERRYAEGQFDRLSTLATELARLNVDVIVTASSPPAKAAKSATTSIPIVILDPGDPVATGLVTSLARPGGNVTGVSSIAPDLAAKRLEMLKEAAPRTSRVAVLFNAVIPPAEIAMTELKAAAQTLGLRIQSVAVQGPKGFEEAFGTITQARADGLIVFPDPLTFNNQELIANFAAQSRIFSLFGAKEFVEIGGLMSYGPSYPAMFRRGAYYVDRILKGAKPADLPVEQPTKFELVINLKTAKALDLDVPEKLRALADEVIE